MLYALSYGNMEIMVFTSQEAAASLMSVAAPLWFWKFREKNSEFWIFFENYGKSQIIISKVGGKL